MAKYRLVVALVVLVLAVQVVGASTVARANAEEECGEAHTTADMLRCATSRLGPAEQELETLRQLLRRELTAEEWDAYARAEAAWLAFRQTNCLSAASLYRGGSMESIAMSTCVLRMTKERSRELRVLYKDVLNR